MIGDTNERYGLVSKSFHWFMAILVGWQLLKIGDRIAEGEHWVGQTLVPWHLSIGTLVLVLIVFRILWTLSQLSHRPQQNPATAFLVKAGHFLLYAAMLLMPVTGIMAMVGGGYGLSAFGVQWIAEGPKLPWAATLGNLHSPLAWLLLIMVVGHIGIALIHHFIKRDDTLRRMI